MKLYAKTAAVCLVLLLIFCLEPALAQTDKGADTDTEPATIVEVRTTSAPYITGEPFSVPGNGEVLDDISDDSKEFYIITTKNNNTFYLVIDKANSAQNVYMLSKVDEADLAEFIDGGIAPSPTPTPAPTVIIKQPDITPIVTNTDEKETDNEAPVLDINKIIVIAAIGVFALIFYFKVYKPKKERAVDDEEGIEREEDE